MTIARALRGFSLIELLVVVVIVAILGLVAIPSYRQYNIRAQRTEAKTALLRLAANQERFYLQNNSYSTEWRLIPDFLHDLHTRTCSGC